MDLFRRWWARLTEWRRPEAVESDLTAEVESHLAFLIEEHLRQGRTPEQARRAALMELGGLEQARALLRDARGFRMLDAIRTDLRLAVRHLRHTPGFTAAALITLALGIGANTAIFSLVDAVMLRPLPYAEPDRLVALWETIPARSPVAGGTTQGQPTERVAVAPANLGDYSRMSSLSSLAAYASVGRNIAGGNSPERVTGEEITANYFTTLGITPVLGRAFVGQDNDAGHAPVVIVSHALWQRRFGGAGTIGGKTLRLNGTPHEVIGVMPADFVALTQPGQSEPVSVWLPIVFEAGSLANRKEHLVEAVGRLTPGISLETARAELAATSAALGREFPDASATQAAIAPLRADQVSEVRLMLIVLLAAVGLVLLVACVNVAGLLLVRELGRRREMAVRFALGASRARVVLEQVVQSSVLAAAGGAAGLLLGWVTIRGLVAVAPASMPHIQQAGLDGRVLVFTVTTAVLTALVFGTWPAFQAARVDPVNALKDGERSVSTGWVLRRRGGLLITEVALSAVLLAGAVLMSRSLITLDRVDLGFDPTHVLAASVTLPPDRYDTPEARLAFFESLETRLKQTPGVTAVAFGNRLPLRGNWISGMVLDADPAFTEAGFQAVSTAYFEAFGIPLLRGRALTSDDRVGAPGVALVNEAFSRVLLEGANPVGHVVRRGPDMPAITIVGVVGDVRRTGRTDESGTRTAAVTPQVYLPAAQTALYPLHLREVAVRTTPNATGIGEAVRAAVVALDPDQPITAVRTLEESLALGSAQKRFQTSLFVLFAVVAFGLALVGVYGVVAYGVSQRSAEIGLRLALGATKPRIVAEIMRRTARLVGAGIILGLSVALLSSRLLTSLLFEVAPTDPATYVLTAVGLLVAGVAAGGLAGLRATRIEPSEALR
jgi:putative ABC transport system permease protein